MYRYPSLSRIKIWIELNWSVAISSIDTVSNFLRPLLFENFYLQNFRTFDSELIVLIFEFINERLHGSSMYPSSGVETVSWPTPLVNQKFFKIPCNISDTDWVINQFMALSNSWNRLWTVILKKTFLRRAESKYEASEDSKELQTAYLVKSFFKGTFMKLNE